jgi:hypothetical protein
VSSTFRYPMVSNLVLVPAAAAKYLYKNDIRTAFGEG